MRIGRRVAGAAATAAVVALSLTGCGSSDEGSSASGGGPTKVTVSFNPASQDAPLFLGMKEGIFAKHGLEVSLVPQTDVAAIISGVASGQYDFGFATVVHVINAHANKIPIKAVSTVDGQQAKEEAPDMGNAMLAGPNSGIKSPADLGGKTLGVIGLASLNTLAAQQLASDGGVDVKTIKLVQLPFGQMPAALANGDIDAAVVQSPFIAEAMSGGSTVIAKPNVQLFADKAVGVFTTSDKLIGKSPAVVDGFSKAMVESQQYAADHVDEGRQTLVDNIGLTPEAAKVATWCTTCDPTLDTEGFTVAQQMMKQFAGLKDTPDVKEYVYEGAIAK